MCYNPITIVNPTRYVSLQYRDRFTLRVPCGKCAQCQTNKRNEYYARAYYHATECLNNQGFVLFDTLTYAPKFLPHISDYFPTLYNFSCFDSTHIRKFIARLRQRVKRKYNSNFDYFLSSEYGVDNRFTNRPHYHVLFFVRGSINPLIFSQLIADCWKYGRTDGIPYKSRYYVANNVLTGADNAKTVRVLKYVTKYISKSCLFTKEIEKRVNKLIFDIAKLYDKNWLDSLDCQLFREKIMRHVGQFHRQSTGFGSVWLRDCNVADVMSSGQLKVIDNKQVILSIPLPTYYKRKLFYEQVEVDGCLLWTPTELGYDYLRCQEQRLIDRTKLRLQANAMQSHITIDVNEMTDYLVHYRGRIKADAPESTLQQRLQHVDYYKYATRYDRRDLGALGLVKENIGNRQIGFYVLKMPPHIKLFSFGRRFSFYDKEKEKLLDTIDYTNHKVDVGKQSAYELKQRLAQVCKMLV